MKFNERNKQLPSSKERNCCMRVNWIVVCSNQNLLDAKYEPFLTYSTLNTRGGLLLLFVVVSGLTADMGQRVNHQCVLQPAQSCCEGSSSGHLQTPDLMTWVPKWHRNTVTRACKHIRAHLVPWQQSGKPLSHQQEKQLHISNTLSSS